MSDQAPTLIDLFAGCGGMTRGFVDAGFEPILAVEFDLAAASTYKTNFPGARVDAEDIAAVQDAEVSEVDVVIGGPPCQGFSGLGRRDPTDERNQLWLEYKRLVHLAHPKVFVIENVAGFLRSPEFAALEEEFAIGDLTEYEYISGVLHAEDFGVPQKRHRAFVVASRVGTPSLPIATHSQPGLGIQHPWQTVEDALRGLPAEPASTLLPTRVSSPNGFEVPGPFTELEIHVGRTYESKSLERYDLIAPGRGRLDLPPELQYECWKKKKSGTSDVLGRLSWGKPSVTIRTEFFKPEKGRYLHPRWEAENGATRANRAITHAEAARLQTFPPTYEWCGGKVAIARQIGNAVPPTLAFEIARQVVVPLLDGTAASGNGRRPSTLQLPLASVAELGQSAERLTTAVPGFGD